MHFKCGVCPWQFSMESQSNLSSKWHGNSVTSSYSSWPQKFRRNHRIHFKLISKTNFLSICFSHFFSSYKTCYELVPMLLPLVYVVFHWWKYFARVRPLFKCFSTAQNAGKTFRFTISAKWHGKTFDSHSNDGGASKEQNTTGVYLQTWINLLHCYWYRLCRTVKHMCSTHIPIGSRAKPFYPS